MPFDNTNLDDTTRLLLDARGYIERGWCRGELARDKDGERVSPIDKRAVQRCLYGALYAAGLDPAVRKGPATDRLRKAIGGGNLVDFNNAQTDSAPILAAFDCAIAGGVLSPALNIEATVAYVQDLSASVNKGEPT